MAYMLPYSMNPHFDNSGGRVFDGLLQVIREDSGSPAPAYTAHSLSETHPSPVRMRSGGIWPQIYLAPGEYRVRVISPRGQVYSDVRGLRIDPPPAQSGGGSNVDPTRLHQTGDILRRYGTGQLPGSVRCNGRTIGSAASSATERANDDCQALFVFLYTQDANLAVSGGRGANAQSDWEAGKTIALPDARGRFLLTLDDLGSTAAGRLTGGLFTFGNATTLGSYGGEASHVQTLAELASHSHTATGTMTAAGGHNHTGTTGLSGSHFHGVSYRQEIGYATPGNFVGITSVGAAGANPNLMGFTDTVLDHSHTYTTSTVAAHTHALTVSVASRGSSAAMNWLPPFLLVSTYLKL